jgi:hypothetical protein
VNHTTRVGDAALSRASCVTKPISPPSQIVSESVADFPVAVCPGRACPTSKNGGLHIKKAKACSGRDDAVAVAVAVFAVVAAVAVATVVADPSPCGVMRLPEAPLSTTVAAANTCASSGASLSCLRMRMRSPNPFRSTLFAAQRHDQSSTSVAKKHHASFMRQPNSGNMAEAPVPMSIPTILAETGEDDNVVVVVVVGGEAAGAAGAAAAAGVGAAAVVDDDDGDGDDDDGDKGIARRSSTQSR